jgi:peptide/nickel transport system ATP-binding protein
LFITHDLSLGNYISEKTVILRRGVVVEMGHTDKVFGNPMHPYTKILISSVPQLHKKWAEVEAELEARGGREAGVCLYHKTYRPTHLVGDGPEDRPAMVKVEEDHYVGCFELGQGVCQA